MCENYRPLGDIVRLGIEALDRTDVAQAELYLLQSTVIMINTDEHAPDRPSLRNAQGKLYLYEEQFVQAEEKFHAALTDARDGKNQEQQLAAMVGLMATYREWGLYGTVRNDFLLSRANEYGDNASKLVNSDEWSMLKVDYYVEKALLQKAENKNALASFTIDYLLRGFENLQKTDINLAELRKRIAYAYAIKASVFNQADDDPKKLIGYINKAWERINAGVDTKTYVEVALIIAEYYSKVNPVRTIECCDDALKKLTSEPISEQVNDRYIKLLVGLKTYAMENLPTKSKV